MAVSLLIVIPAHNEAAIIGATASRLRAQTLPGALSLIARSLHRWQRGGRPPGRGAVEGFIGHRATKRVKCGHYGHSRTGKSRCKRLAKEINPVSILVFGSVAKMGKGEDLVLSIVTEDAQKDLKTLFAQVHRLLVPFLKGFAIDPFVLPRSLVTEHFLTGSLFLRLVQREGRCLRMKESVKAMAEAL